MEYGDWPGAGTGLPLQGNVFAVTWEGSGKAVKAHRGVLCRDGPCFAHVLKPSKWSMATWPGAGKGLPLQGNVFAVTWEGIGKAVKAHRGVLCRDGPCIAHVLKPSKWSMATWPGAGKGLPLQGNVFAVTWEGIGKAVKAHRGVLCRDGPCIAHVLKASKWSMATWPGAGKGLPLQGNVLAVTWEGSGKAVNAHRRVLCRDGPCFAHVLKPSKWSMATWPGAGKGLPLQGNVFAVTWEGSGKAVKAHRGVLFRDGPCFAHVLKPSK